MKAVEVKDKINYLASNGKEFLFGVDFELTEGFLVENPKSQKGILFRTPLAGNSFVKNAGGEKNGELSITSEPESYERYKKRFDVIMNGLMRGDSFLTNLTVRTPIETSLSLLDIFNLSTAPYCLYYPGKFVCFSPEIFVRISNGVISTNPMKGTIDAGIPNAAEIILCNEKETREHNTVVDLLRNDLGMVADDVHTEKFRYIDRISTNERDILQVSSKISGQLHRGYLNRLGDILFTLLPAGSISGAPKSSTVNLIRQAEGIPRGYYTGIFGYFDGCSLDSAVMIRFIEEQNGKKYFRSGGGITVLSEPQSEYDEVMEKIYLPFVGK